MKITHFSVNLPWMFRYVIENILGISANSIPKCQEFGIEMSESQALYF